MRTPRRPEIHAAFPRVLSRRTRSLSLAKDCSVVKAPSFWQSQNLFTGTCTWLFLLSLLLPSDPAAAQTASTGVLHGTLIPSQPGILLTLRNQETGQTYPITPRPDRTFLLPALPPGEYLLAGPALPSVPITIRPGETTEFPTRSQPPAEPEPQPDQDDDGLQSFHALPSTQNTTLVDGLSLTQNFHSTPLGTGSDPAPDPAADSDSAEQSTGPAFGLSRGRRAGAANVFSSAAIREFRLSETASQILATTAFTTRAGSQHLHGSALFLFRSQLFAATNPLSLATTYTGGVSSTSPVKPHDLRQTYIATLGGPIPRTSIFFFYTFDAQRRSFPAISSPANPAFYTLTPIQQALLRTRGVSTAATQSALTYLASLTGETPRRADQTINFARLDWRPRRQAVALSYNRLRWNHPAGLTEAPVVASARNSLGNSNGSADTILLGLTSAFNSRRINRLALQLTRDLQYESPQAPLPQEPAIAPGGLAPEVVIGPEGLRFGTPANLSRQAYPDERRLELADALTFVLGHHLLQLGGTFSALDDRIATEPNASGTFRYDSTRTTANAGGLVDFITDQTFNVNTYPNGACPSISAPTHLFCFTSFTQSFGQTRITFPTQTYAAFVQETWHLRPRLTLTAGLRYDYLLLPVPQQPNPALDLLFSSRGATSIFPEDRNNLGPHAALAAEPFGPGRLTLSLGYSTFFGRLPGATVAAALSETALPTSTRKIRILPSAVTACPQIPANGFGYPCSFTAQPTGVVASTTSATVFDRHFRLPDIQQLTLRLARTLGSRTELSASYLLNLDRQLPSSTDLNIAPSTSQASFLLQNGPSAGLLFGVPLYTSRVSSSFGPVTDILSDGNATYNALVLTVRTRLRSVLTATADYTFSKALDTGVALTGIPRTDNRFDPFTNGYDKAISPVNYPHFLRVAAVATSPRTPHRLLAGWDLAPVVLLRSGRPYSYDIFGGSRLPGGHLSINGSGGALYLPTVGRDTLRLPFAVQSNLRLARMFTPARSRVTLRLAAEAFNLTNRVNLSSVEQRAYLPGTPTAGVTPLLFQDASTIAAEGLNTQPFSTPTAAASSLQRERQLQFSLHLAF